MTAIISKKLLSIRLLGGFSVTYGGESVVGINTARLKSLLAYLVLHADRPQARQHIAFLLWPDTSEAKARNNLRQFLFQLRQALPDSDRFLFADAQSLSWHVDEDQTIDVHLFARALAEVTEAEQRADWNSVQSSLNEALSTYQGELLPGCYDDWITPDRDRLREQCHSAYQKMVHVLELRREYVAALQAAQAMLRLDPLDENANVTLMRLHDLNHDRPAARRVYLSAAEALRRELGVEPGETLQRAYERLQHAPDAVLSDHASRALTLVGRQSQWQQLHAAWERAANGNAHLALIMGEAGMGKSRLAEELFTWAERQGFSTAYTRSYAAEGRLALGPITEWLQSASLRPHLRKLDNAWLTEIARLLPELLDEDTDLTRPEPIGEYGERQRFFEALARAIRIAPQPILLWVDDLQWCDPETLEWLHFLLRSESRLELLILGTARSEESPSDHPLAGLMRQLRAEGKLVTIELSSLDAAETTRLASQIDERNWDTAASLRLYRETEGNPLFIVETVRAGISSDWINESTPISELEHESLRLPPRVYAVIAGRVAQLSPRARKVAELGAAIGRAFTFDVLRLAGQDNEENTVQALDELWQRRIVREQSANVFDFTHDKLREVVYAEISAPQRRLLHHRIAQALESLTADTLDQSSSQIASQYEQAGRFEQALPYYQRAGDIAASIYANDDAIDLIIRGLALLPHLSPGAKRDSQELSLLLALATLYRIAKGWASPEEEQVMTRAAVLSDMVGDAQQRIRTLFGLQTLYVVQARYEKVEHTYAEAERLFMQTQGTPPPPFARINVAGAKLFMGQMVEARKLFESIVAVRDMKRIRDLQESQGLNYLVHGLAWNSHALWCLGYPQAALNNARAAIEFAHEFAQPFNQALAITYLSLLQEWCAYPDAFRMHAEEAYALTREYAAPYYHAWSDILLSFAQVEQEPDVSKLTRLRGAILAFTETGARVRLTVYYSLLARACVRVGRFDEGAEAIEQGLHEALQNNERWWDAELHRLRGELWWAQGAAADEVEVEFQRSLEIARSQQARSLELRTATNLARLWQATGRAVAARQLLAPLYDWFTEGFDTPDLQSARTLITQLSKTGPD